MDKILEALKYAKHIDIAPVNKMWERILGKMAIQPDDFDNTLQITGYHAHSPKFLDAVEDLLKVIFISVTVREVEDSPWRRVFVCKNAVGEESLVCVAWYHTGPDF